MGECLTLNIPSINPLLQNTIVKHRITPFLINEWSQMTGLLMSDDWLKGFTESLKTVDTALDLTTQVSPLYKLLC